MSLSPCRRCGSAEEWDKMGKAADAIPKTPGATCRAMY